MYLPFRTGLVITSRPVIKNYLCVVRYVIPNVSTVKATNFVGFLRAGSKCVYIHIFIMHIFEFFYLRTQAKNFRSRDERGAAKFLPEPLLVNETDL